MKQYDIAIIGGGAAGLFAAAYIGHQCREQGRTLTVAVFEKGKRVGRKLAVTGNGTCNLSHIPVATTHYHGTDNTFSARTLTQFPPETILRFFQTIGVETHQREDGRIYPDCLQATAVLDCLRMEMLSYGIDEHCEEGVTILQPAETCWHLTTEHDTYKARAVLLATGGCASPSSGGSVDGYSLFEALSYQRTPLFPSIVPVRTDTSWVRSVKGIRVDAAVRFTLDGRTVSEAEGEVLFTDYGLSGPAIMQASRPIGDWERHKRGEAHVHIDFFPSRSREYVSTRLASRLSMTDRYAEDWFTGFLHKRLGQTLLRSCNIALDTPLSKITSAQVSRVAAYCKNWTLPVEGTAGFNMAQVTAGGVSTNGFNAKTMASKRHPGLYAAGEALDVDGDCGGYNLQWAWSSAMAAATAILNTMEAI